MWSSAERTLLAPLRSGSRAFALAAWTAAMTEASVVALRLVPPSLRGPRMQAWVRVWARGLLRVFGVEACWAGVELPPARGARLVLANHRSPLDIILMLERFGGSVLARHDLERWPVLGRAAREAGTIFVDREDAGSGSRAIREIRRRLRAGQTVIVFPEGTTHSGDLVHSFRGGAFAALRGLDVELIPVGVAYPEGAEFVDESFTAHVTRVSRRRTTRVALCCGKPRKADMRRDELADEMQRAVQALVEEARAAFVAACGPHER